MISFFKRFLGVSVPDHEEVTVDPGKIFPWPKGLRLQATEDVEFAFPGELIRQGEIYGDIFEISDDDADVGFFPRADGSLESIHVRIRAGQSILLHRSADAILIADDPRERIVIILAKPEPSHH